VSKETGAFAARWLLGAAIIGGARDRIAPGGFLAVEHGFDQSDAVRGHFEASGFVAIEASRDLAGRWRVVAGRMPETA